jgi:hypothetical protein
MVKGRVTISIDLELAWGTWDVLTPEHLSLAEALERPICAALIELFDRYEVAATWAIVAGLLDASCSTARPGHKACWYAPDIIERVTQAKVGHEIGSSRRPRICPTPASGERPVVQIIHIPAQQR